MRRLTEKEEIVITVASIVFLGTGADLLFFKQMGDPQAGFAALFLCSIGLVIGYPKLSLFAAMVIAGLGLFGSAINARHTYPLEHLLHPTALIIGLWVAYLMAGITLGYYMKRINARSQTT